LASRVGRVAKQNPDLREAADHARQGKVRRKIVASQGLPHLDADGS
jgi:outer membrane protein TolC